LKPKKDGKKRGGVV